MGVPIYGDNKIVFPVETFHLTTLVTIGIITIVITDPIIITVYFQFIRDYGFIFLMLITRRGSIKLCSRWNFRMARDIGSTSSKQTECIIKFLYINDVIIAQFII